MIRTAAKFFLLSLAVAVHKNDECDGERSVPPESIMSTCSPLTTVNIYLHENLDQQQKENETLFPASEGITIDRKSNNSSLVSLQNEFSAQNGDKNSKSGLNLFLQEIKACRENYPFMDKRLFKLQLYCFLMNEIAGTPNGSTGFGFHCNISRRTVDELRGKIHELKTFQRIFFTSAVNNSCESLNRVQTSQQVKSEVIAFRRNLGLGVENNLKLKLGDEWIPLGPKVSHVSHIYLGTSIFPILTEESRIIDKDHTLRSPPSTKSSFTKETQQNERRTDSQSPSGTAAKIYQLLRPFRWQKNLKTEKNQSRFSRSFDVIRTSSKYLESDNKSNDKIVSDNDYKINSKMSAYVPEKVNSLFRRFVGANDTTRDESLSKVKGKYPIYVEREGKDPFYSAMSFLWSSVAEIIKDVFIFDFFKIKTKKENPDVGHN